MVHVVQGWKQIGCMRIGQRTSHIRFHIFKMNMDKNTDVIEYECRADVARIRMMIRRFLNSEGT
jgi:hypothetical protein